MYCYAMVKEDINGNFYFFGDKEELYSTKEEAVNAVELTEKHWNSEWIIYDTDKKENVLNYFPDYGWFDVELGE